MIYFHFEQILEAAPDKTEVWMLLAHKASK